MASTYPSVIATLTYPNPNQKLNSPSHSSVHGSENDEIIQTQTFVGTTASAIGTLVYDVRAAASNGGGHVQTAATGGTGQTIYTKGDVLVAQSSSVLTKLAIGTNGQALVADSSQAAGIKWGVPNNGPTMVVYSAASTLSWVKPSNLSYIVVEVVGGGGGGNNGGAGGAGGWGKKILTSSVLSSVETVVIGIAGSVGGTGGLTYFGTTSYLSAIGGTMGQDTGGGGSQGGPGGAATGDFSINGSAGGKGTQIIGNVVSKGADTPMGYGSGGLSSVLGGSGLGAGADATGYGAGGGGGTFRGIGSGGLVVITQY